MVAGDIGTPIILRCHVDISGATVMRVYYTSPITGTTGYWTAIAYGDEAIQYVTSSGSDVLEAGMWKVQAYVETATWTRRGFIAEFPVAEVLS